MQENCRECGQTQGPGRENKNCEIFFPGMFVGAKFMLAKTCHCTVFTKFQHNQGHVVQLKV